MKVASWSVVPNPSRRPRTPKRTNRDLTSTVLLLGNPRRAGIGNLIVDCGFLINSDKIVSVVPTLRKAFNVKQKPYFFYIHRLVFVKNSVENKSSDTITDHVVLHNRLLCRNLFHMPAPGMDVVIEVL